MQFIEDITCTIYDMSSTVYDITFSICLTSHSACISDIKNSMFMTYPLYMASHTVLWQHNNCVSSETLCMYVIPPTVSVSSHPKDQFYQTKCMYDITATMCMTSYALHVTSHPQFKTSHHFMYDIRSTLSDLTSTVSLSSHPSYRWYYSHYMYDLTPSISVTSHPLYLWHNIQKVSNHNTLCWWRNTRHMYDILCTADDTSPTLSHQTTVFMMSHPLKAWNHSPCIRHRTHSISVISPSPLTSHTLLYDITANFCVTSYELYITTHVILMSSHYSIYDITASIYETTSRMRATYTLNMWHHIHYLCQHTHSIDIITPTLFMTSHSPCVCHHLHYTRHHILTFWPQITILRTSHPLYYTSCPLYLCHYTNSIDDITATICMTSHPLYVRNSVPYIYDIIPTRYDNRTLCVVYTTLGICMTSFALQKTSHPLEHTKPQSLWLHIHFRHDITAPVSDITPTVSLSSKSLHCYDTHFCMTSHPLYVWHHMH